MSAIYYLIQTDIEPLYTHGNTKDEYISFFKHRGYDVFIYSLFFCVYSRIEGGCKGRLLVVIVFNRLFFFFSIYILPRGSPWCEREALEGLVERKRNENICLMVVSSLSTNFSVRFFFFV
jgi:hypothetical protein